LFFHFDETHTDELTGEVYCSAVIQREMASPNAKRDAQDKPPTYHPLPFRSNVSIDYSPPVVNEDHSGPPEIPNQEIIRGDFLGEGAFGKVYKGIYSFIFQMS
jgi:hypothetical protein